MLRLVDVVHAGGVEINRVEARRRAVDDLEPGALLHREVHQQRAVLQLGERLEGHELVVGLWRPRVDLDGVAEGDHQELDALVLDDLEVHGALELADIDPACEKRSMNIEISKKCALVITYPLFSRLRCLS